MDDLVGHVVMPGDFLFDLQDSNSNEKLVFGPGLRREGDRIIAAKCGILRKQSTKTYFVDNHQVRYVPIRGETVIGVVTKKGSDEILLDIGSSESAVVDLLSFEGATKRNKPALKVGDTIFAKIVVACKDTEPELVCVNSYGKSQGLGLLPEGGFIFSTSLDYCRRLLMPNSPILKRLGQMLPFEITVGHNGRIWVKSTSLSRTLVLVQAINVLENASEDDIEKMCEGLAAINSS